MGRVELGDEAHGVDDGRRLRAAGLARGAREAQRALHVGAREPEAVARGLHGVAEAQDAGVRGGAVDDAVDQLRVIELHERGPVRLRTVFDAEPERLHVAGDGLLAVEAQHHRRELRGG